MTFKLSHTRKFSELKHGDWFIDRHNRIGIKIDLNKQLNDEGIVYRAHYFGPYKVLQWMSGLEEVQQLENVFVSYEYAQMVTKEVVVTQEVDENKKGCLSFNEIPF